jgi:membrane fusion protein (multidrug efflux system)
VRGDEAVDVSAEGAAGLVGQPELQQAGVEAESLLGGEARVEAGRGELRLLGRRIEGGRVGEELIAGRHQVLTDAGEGPDVLAFPEHHLVGFLGGFLFGQAMQRRAQAEFEPAQRVSGRLVREAEQDPGLLPDGHEQVRLVAEVPIDRPTGHSRLLGDFFERRIRDPVAAEDLAGADDDAVTGLSRFGFGLASHVGVPRFTYMFVCKPLSVERLLLGAALLALVGCRQESAPPAPGPLPVAIMTVAPADLAQQAVAPAQVEGVREVEVRARVTGILQTVDYAEGAKVKAGDLLFRIDPAPYAAAYALARAQLAQETARAEQATAEAARQAALFKQKAASRKEADDAQAQAAAAVAARDAAAARAELAKLDLDYCEVRSPIAGVAGRRLRTEGTLVNPIGPDGLLTTVVRADEVWARFGLAEADFHRLFPAGAAGAQGADVALLRPDGSTHPARGKVDFAATQVDTRLGTVQLRARFANADDALLAGQFVRVRITGGKAKDAYLVPQQALVQAPSGRSVFVIGAGDRAEARTVTLGETHGADIVILAGLRAGDRVILNQLHKLRPGAPVVVAPAKK